MSDSAGEKEDDRQFTKLVVTAIRRRRANRRLALLIYGALGLLLGIFYLVWSQERTKAEKAFAAVASASERVRELEARVVESDGKLAELESRQEDAILLLKSTMLDILAQTKRQTNDQLREYVRKPSNNGSFVLESSLMDRRMLGRIAFMDDIAPLATKPAVGDAFVLESELRKVRPDGGRLVFDGELAVYAKADLVVKKTSERSSSRIEDYALSVLPDGGSVVYAGVLQETLASFREKLPSMCACPTENLVNRKDAGFEEKDGGLDGGADAGGR
ncbi:MAG: hypothetical protein Q8N23_05325 [Archangium sp.]|nr:hypothetical protein [Archangium sp.]MDP3574562.1 hypothetical protein [Archangium sp.]